MFLEQRQNDLSPLDPAFVYLISYFQIQRVHTLRLTALQPVMLSICRKREGGHCISQH